MLKEDKYKQKLKSLLKHEKKYDFSEFLFALRNISGAQREFVSRDIGMTSHKLSKIEKGQFVKPLPTWVLKTIALYYGVDYEILKLKLDQFIEDGKSKPSLRKVG